MNLEGKKALVLGLANERSIAWGVTQALKNAGARLALTYIEAVEKRLRPLAEQVQADWVLPCDVASDADLGVLAEKVSKDWDNECDIVIHSVAFADREDLARPFSETSRKGFHTALDISAYSLIGLCGALKPALQKSQASVITMTYYGSEKVIPHYNVMGVAKAALECSVRYLASDLGETGVRVNAISAGPIRTLAASGVKDFRSMLNQIEDKAPLKRNVDIEDVGQTALFLASPAAKGITGEVIYVDSGYHIMGM